MRVKVRSLGLLVVLTLVVVPAWGSFSGTDVVLPSVGRGPGSAGSQWYTCMWIHNPQGGPVNVQVQFLERNKSNVNPLVWSATVPAGDTQRLDNAVETLFGVSGKFGALRITSSDRVLVAGRIYSMPQGGEAQDSVGQFFSAVPTSFAITSGQSTTLLGVYQTNPQTSSEFRYNFGFVEVGGGTATVKVTALEPDGTTAGSKSYALSAWEPRQYNITDLLPAVNAANLRLKVEVVAGSGKVVAFGSGLANRSNDPSTFEMSFSDELLGGSGGLTSVAHDASLTGNGTASTPLGVASGGVQTSHLADDAVTTSKLAASGSNPGQVLTSDGTNVVWQTPSTGGGGGITSVVHDATLSGEGTVAVPLRLGDGAVGKAKLAAVGGTSGQVLGTDGTTLVWQTPSGSGGGGDITAVNAGTGLSGGGTSGDVTVQVAAGGIATTLLADGAVTGAKVATGQVVKGLNGLRDEVTLAPGANITITPAGNTLTIAASGGGGSGVTNVNGVTGAVTVTGSGGTTVSTAGSTITVSSTPGGGGITGVTAGAGLIGGGATGTVNLDVGAGDGISVNADTIMVADNGVGTPKLVNGAVTTVKLADGAVVAAKVADLAVTKGKLAASGGSAGQVLALAANGIDLEWKPDNAGGLALPFSGSGSSGSFVFQATNSAAGPGIAAISTGDGVSGLSSGGHGVYGRAGSATPLLPTLAAGVFGDSASGYGVVGFSTSVAGVWGSSSSADGVMGSSSGSVKSGVYGTTSAGDGFGVYGFNETTQNKGYLGGAVGVYGLSTASVGVKGESSGGNGVVGKSSAAGGNGVYAEASAGDGLGVSGRNTSNGNWGYLGGGLGVYGESISNDGVEGRSTSAAGVRGFTDTGYAAVWGTATVQSGVFGQSTAGTGVLGWSANQHGVFGHTDNATAAGVFARNQGAGLNACLACGTRGAPYAGDFSGNVYVEGNLVVTGSVSKGSGSFKIDHPLDPENKYLYHSFVESPDMMNIYDGIVTTDGSSLATVTLPDWFEALNRDFRYQLTVIGSGTWARARVAREIDGNTFVIETDVPHTRVSWQVTGIRHDPFAEVHRVPVEEDKPESERGRLLHPEAYGRPGPEPGMSAR